MDALLPLVPPLGPVLIAIPDTTRSMDTGAALEALSKWISASTQVTVRVGLGLHRKSTKTELNELRSRSPWPVEDHTPGTCLELPSLGEIPIQLPAEVCKARSIITVGTVELHQYAGFSGGYKGVVIGCGGRGMIEALHHRDFVTQEGIRVGQLRPNPFREHIDAIGKGLPATTALQWVPDHGWMAGEPVHTLECAAALLEPFHPMRHAAHSVTLKVPPSKAVNFYQASRAATYLALSPRPPLQEGATLYLEAACPEGIGHGIGERNFAKALASCPPPWTSLLEGPFEFGGGAQRAVMLALLSQRYRLKVTGCLNPSPLRELGIDASSELTDHSDKAHHLVVPQPFLRLPQLA